MGSCDVDWQILLEYLRVLLSWPAITLFLLMFVLQRFRRDISALLSRTTGADLFGQKLQFAHEQGVPIRQPPAVAGHEELGPKIAEKPVTTNGRVEPSPQPSAGPASPSGTDGVKRAAHDPDEAARQIVTWWLAAKHESILNRIYGTQLRALSILDAKDTLGETRANLSPYYSEHERLSAAGRFAPSSAPDYIAFLTSMNGLARIEGDGDDAKFFITPAGKVFIQYLRQNYPVLPPRAF